MNEIINVKFKMLWNAPVCVATGDRIASFVHGPEDAIHYLCVHWPSARGASHARAKKNALPPFRIG
jgi:uncharacterized protein YbdZ (MbtH family)